MNCQICGCDPELIVVLPIKRPDGALITLACLECSEKSGTYCLKHQKPHLGFESDDTTACRECIEEEVASLADRADEIYTKLEFLLEKPEFADLLEAAEASSAITGNWQEISILRFIVTKAQRLKKLPDEIIADMMKDNGSVSSIL